MVLTRMWCRVQFPLQWGWNPHPPFHERNLLWQSGDNSLFNFFVNCMFIAVGAKLFQLQTSCGVAAVLRRRVARDTGRSLVGITATLGTFQCNDDADALLTSHRLVAFQQIIFDTNNYCFIRRLTSARSLFNFRSRE